MNQQIDSPLYIIHADTLLPTLAWCNGHFQDPATARQEHPPQKILFL